VTVHRRIDPLCRTRHGTILTMSNDEPLTLSQAVTLHALIQEHFTMTTAQPTGVAAILAHRQKEADIQAARKAGKTKATTTAAPATKKKTAKKKVSKTLFADDE